LPDAVFEEVRQQFAEDEVVKLTLAVAMINAWNRMAISFRSVHTVKSSPPAALAAYESEENKIAKDPPVVAAKA
jgi:hypothetical protein